MYVPFPIQGKKRTEEKKQTDVNVKCAILRACNYF